MRQLYCFTVRMLAFAALFLTISTLNAQQRPPLTPPQSKAVLTPTNTVSPFEVTAPKADFQSVVKEATYLKLNAENLQKAMQSQPREMVFSIPQKNGGKVDLLLERQDILAPDFKVTNQKGEVIPWQAGSYYRGVVLDRKADKDKNDHPHAHAETGQMAALSIVDGEIMGMMSIDGDNYVLGKVGKEGGKKATDYVLYNDANLSVPNNFHCQTAIEKHLKGTGQPALGEMAVATNVVKVYFEADYQTYLDKGSSIGNVVAYVTGLFNMVATIYHNESIVTQISQVGVWTIADPYNINSGVGSGTVLNNFSSAMSGGFNGDLAHLVSTKNVGHGGIAWIDVLCYGANKYYRTAYSNISNSYNNFPLYSWTIDVVTHEMGHNLGSPHTHDCAWGAGGNQSIDNCYSNGGGCPAAPAPVNGGTIMSYCHLTAAGKNFNLGFGPQPGNLIRSRVNAAACLGDAFLNCAGATSITCGQSISGSTVGAPNNVSVYGCNSWLQSGGERVFKLQTTEPGNITATLSNLSADLDVIILDACSESNCLAEGNNSATVWNASPGMYFIVVDGYHGAAGSFTLTVNCNGHCFTTGLTNFEFIQNVSVGSINNASGNNYGYADFTSKKTAIQRGGSAPVSLTPGFISGSWTEYWRIWIDFNNDKDFTDAGELVFASGGSATTVNGTLYVPNSAPYGETRMRVAMRFGSAPTPCGTFSGEVEDYTVDIQPYCPSLGNTGYEFIDKVVVGNYVNGSGNNGGYANFALSNIELLKGDSVGLELTPGFTGGAYAENWKVWIDFNQDRFFDATEMVFASAAPTDSTQSGKIFIPYSAVTGTTRMRITMQYFSAPSDCSYSFWGETEDYTVILTPFCYSTANSSYEFIQTVGIGSLLNKSGNNGGYADFSDAIGFEVHKGEPTGLYLEPGFTGSKYDEAWRIWVDFNQDKIFDASEQVFEGGPSSGAILDAFILPDDIKEGKYGLRVSMKYYLFPEPCGHNGWGEVEDYTLTVLQTPGLNEPGTGELNGRSDDNTDNGLANFDFAGDVFLAPNPAKDILNVQLVNLEPVAMQIVSMTGQVMQAFQTDNIPTEINVSEYPAGLYLLQVVTAEKKAVTKRFVKSE